MTRVTERVEQYCHRKRDDRSKKSVCRDDYKQNRRVGNKDKGFSFHSFSITSYSI